MNSNRTTGNRLHNYHGTKKQVLGSQAASTPPAWRAANIPNGPASSSKRTADIGSKVFISNLPMDVGPDEVEELFAKTVGPVKDKFLIYNNQGRPKGMAVVHFHKSEAAWIARKKYNGKVVDGRHKIKIEVVVDADEPDPRTQTPAKPAGPPSLLSRITPLPAPKSTPNVVTNGIPKTKTAPPPRAQLTKVQSMTVGPKRRQKKGPKRIKKAAANAAQLDQEMDEYNASAV
ncbi:hypothetical protein OF83DRAFT_1090914 [Amylostereum chailletii]|nr:hypothetical protein OF83DRAFT_1090914 [Amylostereum chailletii]